MRSVGVAVFLTDDFLPDVIHAGHGHHAINDVMNLHLRRDRLLLAAVVRRDGKL